jgi:hypothetical protein
MATGRPNEEVFAIQSDGEPLVPNNMRNVLTGLEERIVVPMGLSTNAQGTAKKLDVIPDGNRGAVIPDIEIELWDRTFLVGIKGTGARIPMYGDGAKDITGTELSQEPFFASESWFGENPWGAMSQRGCIEDKRITELTGPGDIGGFYICPMVRATPLPEWLMKKAQSRFWYKRLDRPGPYYQQTRLMPSDVRLFYQSDVALGRKTPGVMDTFGISDPEDLDGFIENYIRSGMAALTLISRTVREDEKFGHVALDFTDVWLDKDSVIASDGTIFFADIEGLEWIPMRDDDEAKFRMMRQFDRNYYEFMYSLDRLLQERDRMRNRTTTRRALRHGLAARLELALESDPFLEIRQSEHSLRIAMNPLDGVVEGIEVKMLDFE